MIEYLVMFATGLYIIFIIALIMDNRSPTSTIAWLLTFFFMPVIGFFLYILIGRNFRFKGEIKMRRNIRIQKKYEKMLSHVYDTDQKCDFRDTDEEKYFNLLKRNSYSHLNIKNRLDVFSDGSDKLKNLLADIEGAKDFIHLQYFIIKDDEYTGTLMDLLAEKADAGLDVRVLVDSVGALSIKNMDIWKLRRKGVKFAKSGKILSLTHFHNLNYRNHQKIAIIDGRVAYTGGMNLAHEYATGGKRFLNWRDTHVRVMGDCVYTIESIFARNWEFSTGDKTISNKRFYPAHDVKEFLPIQVSTSNRYTEWESIEQLYISLISNANKTVFIQSPYYIPSQSIQDVLKIAALSGVDVRLIVTGIADKSIPFWAARTYFPELIRAGVSVYEYTEGFMHSKTVIVDSIDVTVGTTNFDIRSFKLNDELNLMIYDPDVAKKFERNFHDVLKGCRKITPDELMGYSILKKLRNSLFRLLSPLL